MYLSMASKLLLESRLEVTMNPLSTEYQRDFCQWIAQNVTLLRQGQLRDIDVANIAEELESMSISQHHALVNRLKILLMHLLKWQCQPDRRSNSWRRTIVEQRQRIQQLLKTSPSLKYQMDEKITEAYENAIWLATSETGLPESAFPQECPFELEQMLDKRYYPEP
jgi:Domain of unknown function DUF29